MKIKDHPPPSWNNGAEGWRGGGKEGWKGGRIDTAPLLVVDVSVGTLLRWRVAAADVRAGSSGGGGVKAAGPRQA